MLGAGAAPSAKPGTLLRRRAAVSGAAQELSGSKGPRIGAPADEDTERPRAQDPLGPSGKRTGGELDGGGVKHGAKAGVSGVATNGAEQGRAAAGGGVGFENGKINMEEALEGRTGGLAIDGDLEHVDHQDATSCAYEHTLTGRCRSWDTRRGRGAPEGTPMAAQTSSGS